MFDGMLERMRAQYREELLKRIDRHGSTLVLGCLSRLPLPRELREEISERQSQAVWISTVTANPAILKDMQREDITPEIAMTAVRADGLALAHVPSDMIDEKICLEAVKRDGMALEHVPVKLRNHEITGAAIRQNPDAARFDTFEIHARKPEAAAARRPGARGLSMAM